MSRYGRYGSRGFSGGGSRYDDSPSWFKNTPSNKPSDAPSDAPATKTGAPTPSLAEVAQNFFGARAKPVGTRVLSPARQKLEDEAAAKAAAAKAAAEAAAAAAPRAPAPPQGALDLDFDPAADFDEEEYDAPSC